MCHIDEMDLYDFVDKTLAKEEHGKVLMHLKQCEKCRQLVNEIKLMHFDLEHLTPVDVPKEIQHIRQMAIESTRVKAKSTLLNSLRKSPFVNQVMAYNPGKQLGKAVLSGGKYLLNKKKKKTPPLMLFRRLL